MLFLPIDVPHGSHIFSCRFAGWRIQNLIDGLVVSVNGHERPFPRSHVATRYFPSLLSLEIEQIISNLKRRPQGAIPRNIEISSLLVLWTRWMATDTTDRQALPPTKSLPVAVTLKDD